MLRRLSLPRAATGWILLLSLAGPGASAARAQAATATTSPTTPPASEIVQRYEQILERAPMAGPSLDRLLQIYQLGDGLDQLDQRWGKLAAEPGTKGATYSLLRGLLADNAGRTDDALKYLKVATDSLPDEFHGWLALGDAAGHQGRWADAGAAYQKGLATKVAGDDRLILYRKLGKAQQSDLDVTGAMATWRKMVEEFPTDRFAVEEAGTAELDAEQYDEARKTFQHLVDLAEPDSMNRVQALMHLADVDNRQGRTEAAVHGYETILPLTAEGSWLNRQLRAQIEQIFRRDDDVAGLVAYYQRWSLANPKDVDALLLLAGALGELDRKTEALDALRKTTILAPDRHEVRQTFAQLLVEQGQFDEAITVGNALTADDPTEPRYWETLGEAHWKKTQPPTPASRQAALDAWNHIAPADSKDVGAVVELADLLQAHHLDTEALAGYQHGLALTPEAVDIREKEAKLLVAMKRPDEAWAVLDALVADNRGTAVNYAQLAQLQQAFGRGEAAAATLQKGLALDPKSFDLLMAEWNRRATAQDWPGVVAMFDRLMAAAPDAGVAEQIESRHLQALASAGQLEDTATRLQARLGAEPALTEPELRLLIRILIQRSDTAAAKALDEARRRFPQSLSLNRLAADFASQQGSYDAAVASLQRLMELEPQQQLNWLTQIVRVRQQQGNTEEALKTADQLIAASPASSAGYLLYADIAFAAGQADAGIARLQQAIRICEKPNDIRQRLIHYYLDAGLAGKARAVADDAFEAAEEQAERLAMVRLMATAYSQDGRLDELIARFKQEQSGDEEAARNGAYLSAIYDQTQDPQSARRELAKSLAARPHDTALLKSLIALAEKAGDQAELLRYREMLVQIEPIEANQLALATEYAQQDQPAGTWRVMSANQAAVMKDPLKWKDLLLLISDPEYAAKVRGLLETAVAAQGNGSFAGRFALGQFQMVAGNIAGAQKTFWDLLAAPLPLAPATPAAATPPNPATNPGGYDPFATTNPTMMALQMRMEQSYQAMQEAAQLLAPPAARNNGRFQQFGPGRNGATGNTVTDPTAVKDRALVYLSQLAVRQHEAAGFLKELQTHVAEWHWTPLQQTWAFALIQAREPLLQVLETQVKSGTPDRELDQLGYTFIQEFFGPDQDPDPFAENFDSNGGLDSTLAARVAAVRTGLKTRLATEADQHFVSQMALEEAFNNSDYSPAAMEKRRAALAIYLQTVNRRKPEELFALIRFAAQSDDWATVKAAVADLQAIPGLPANTQLRQTLVQLPMVLLSQPNRPAQPPPADLPAVLLQLLRLGYPVAPPVPAPAGIAGRSARMFVNQNQFPPPSKYLSGDQAQMLQQLYQGLRTHKLLPAMETALDAEQKALGDWRQIYPALTRIYFEWWAGRRDDALAATRAQLAIQPEDDLRRLLAAMLVQQKKYDEAIPVLEAMTTGSGQDYINGQMQLLHTANLAKNLEEGKKAGLRLVALHLSPQDLNQILVDLRGVGLTAEATKLQSARTASIQRTSASQSPDQKLMQALQTAANGRDEGKTQELARQILNRDPLALLTQNNSGMARNMRSQALNALRTVGDLEAYASEMAQQADADPGSARKNWVAAEALSALPPTSQELRGLLPGPHWLKVHRTGQQFEITYSTDGTEWRPLGSKVTLKLAPQLLVGLWVSSVAAAPATEVSFEQLAASGPAVAPADAPAPAPVAPAPAAAWLQADLGQIATAGKATLGADPGRVVVTGPVASGGVSVHADGGHFYYQTLDGDGTVVVRVPDIHTQPDRAEIGLMLRETLDVGSLGLEVLVNATRGLVSQTRRVADAQWIALRAMGEFNSPGWLKLAWAGDKVTGSFSRDGKDWGEVFSRSMPLGSHAVAGLLAAGVNQNQGGEFKWASLAMKQTPPASAATPAEAPAATGGVPAPWQYREIGRAKPLGRVTWTDAGVTLSVAGATTPNQGMAFDEYDDYDFPDGMMMSGSDDAGDTGTGFLYQPMAGEGEIVVQSSNPGANTNTGPGLRTGLEPASPGIRLSFGANGFLNLTSRTDLHARAAAYFRQVTVVSPNNLDALRTLLQLQLQTDQTDDATATFALLLKADPQTALQMSGAMLQSFARTDRLPDFMKIVAGWNPPAPSQFNNGPDATYVLRNLGNALERLNHPAEAEQIYRKMLALPTPQSEDLRMDLVRVLVAQNKRTDADGEVVKWFVGEPKPAVEAVTLLGMGNNGNSEPGRKTLFNGYGYNGQEIMPSQGIQLLEMAADPGLTNKLRDILKTQPAPARPVESGMANSDRLTGIFLAVLSHDPAYKADLDKVLAEQEEGKLGPKAGRGFWLDLIRELSLWPQERPQAVQLLRRLFADLADGSDEGMRNLIGFQLVKLAGATGEHPTARAALLSLVQDGGNGITQLGQMQPIGHALIREGLFKEAAAFLSDARSDPQATNGNTYYTNQIDQLQSELDFAKGDAKPAVLAYGIDAADGSAPGADGKVEFFWELQGAKPVLNGRGNGPNANANAATTWSDNIPDMTTNDRLELEAGPDEARLAPLATFDQVAGRGHAPILIPKGTQVLRAQLLPPAAPDGSPQATLVTGPLLYVGTGDNLLPNPGFKVAPDADGKPTLAGWPGLLPSTAVPGDGGPLPKSGYATLMAVNRNFGPNPITSERIPLPAAGQDLIFSGWITSIGNFTFRFLDATGSQTTNNSLGGFNSNDEDWRSVSLRLVRGGRNQTNSVFPIPTWATSMQIIIQDNGNFKAAGLSLRRLAKPEEAPPPPPPAPVPVQPTSSAANPVAPVAPAAPVPPPVAAPDATPVTRTPKSSH
jgi:predicted Zn-dependent protease